MIRARQVTRLVGALCAGFLQLGCVDETHEEAVQALGPEQPGVPKGPLHRPGQPCLTCHGGEGPASAQFTVAGTLYALQGQPDPAISAVAQIEDILGRIWNAKTNAAGNFYVSPSEFTPQYPTQMNVIPAGGDPSQAIPMIGFAGRSGSCADCHKATAGQTSPGPVYVAASNGVP